MRFWVFIFGTFFLGGASLVQGDEFRDYWYDNRAEISTYAISEMRYGELRQGTRVMVFVTEPLRKSTYIKPDENLPAKKKVEVMKLNDLRKFPTGVYDYSVMTSVFASVNGNDAKPPFSTIKVSFTAQEWCGTVFEIIKRQGKALQGNLYSYFEQDGEKSYKINTGNRLETEDNLWLLIRELTPSIFKNSHTLTLDIIPSAWNRRKTHTPAQSVNCSLSKQKSGNLETAIGTLATNLFQWEYDGKMTKVWVERDYPRRILQWQESDGSSGTIIASVRETYWHKNKNSHFYLRYELGLESDHL